MKKTLADKIWYAIGVIIVVFGSLAWGFGLYWDYIR